MKCFTVGAAERVQHTPYPPKPGQAPPKRYFEYIEAAFTPTDYTAGYRICSCCGSAIVDWNYQSQYVKSFTAYIASYQKGILVVINSPTNKADGDFGDYIIDTQVIDGVNVTFRYQMARGD